MLLLLLLLLHGSLLLLAKGGRVTLARDGGYRGIVVNIGEDIPEEECAVLVELKAPKEFQIGFDVICVVANDTSSVKYFRKKNSGTYRSGFVVMPLELTPGTYDVTPSTFYPGQESSFFMTFRASIPIKVSRLQ